MSTNRLIWSTAQKYRFVTLVSTRLSSSAVSPHGQPQQNVTLKPEEQDNPGFLQKVILRFNGVALKGEAHPPKSLFQDCDKEYVVTTPIPPVPKGYKEFPERDLVNFPYPEHHAYPPKTRLFMIPDSWCTPFHKVTGTSGPYVFFGGLAVFLNSKEIFVMEENAMKIFGFWSIYWIFSRTFQFRFDQYLHNQYNEWVEKYNNFIKDDLKEAVEFRKSSAAESASLRAAQESFPTILKENLALQLEATYRKNVNKVATELQRRLDYLQEVEATKLRFEREILLKTITEGVQQKLASNEGNIKESYLDNCITQLKTLSA